MLAHAEVVFMPMPTLLETLRRSVPPASAPKLPTARPYASRIALLAVVLLGCGSREKRDTVESGEDKTIPACDAYVAAMRRCMTYAGPKALAAEADSFAAMQASLTADTKQERAVLSQRCAASMNVLTRSCR